MQTLEKLMQRTLLWKIVLIGLVALLLQVPVGMIRGLVSERQAARDAFQRHSLAVSFIQPVDLYQTVERSAKYGLLFIGLTFAAFFVFEILRRLAIAAASPKPEAPAAQKPA